MAVTVFQAHKASFSLLYIYIYAYKGVKMGTWKLICLAVGVHLKSKYMFGVLRNGYTIMLYTHTFEITLFYIITHMYRTYTIVYVIAVLNQV